MADTPAFPQPVQGGARPATTPGLTAWRCLQRQVLTVDQHRSVDRIAIKQYRMNSLVLMENAARSCIAWLEERFPPSVAAGRPRQMVVLCGKGNNGGDGLAIARHAEYLGWQCSLFMAGELGELSSDARANAEILLAGRSGPDALQICWWPAVAPVSREHSLDCVATADVILDAMLGTGASGNPKAPLDQWIAAANRSTAYRVAIDMPTGINASTGECCEPYFRADATLTFVALKPAMHHPEAPSLFGELEVMSIGIPQTLVASLIS